MRRRKEWDTMYVTMTTFQQKAAEHEKLEEFFTHYLPLVEKQPGVTMLYRFTRPEEDEDVIAILWENEEAWKGYIATPLKQEIDAKTKDLQMTVKREGFPVAYTSTEEKLALKG